MSLLEILLISTKPRIPVSHLRMVLLGQSPQSIFRLIPTTFEVKKVLGLPIEVHQHLSTRLAISMISTHITTYSNFITTKNGVYPEIRVGITNKTTTTSIDEEPKTK